MFNVFKKVVLGYTLILTTIFMMFVILSLMLNAFIHVI